MSDMQAVYKAIAIEVQQQLNQKYAIAKMPKVFLSFQKIHQKLQRKNRFNLHLTRKQ